MKRRDIITKVMLLSYAAMMFIACNYPGTESVRVQSVTLNYTSMSMKVGETSHPYAEVKPIDAWNQQVKWSVNGDAVTLGADHYWGGDEPSAYITAVSPGTATITATTVDGGYTASCVVTVTQPVSYVTISPSSISLRRYETRQLTATVYPENATDKGVTWSVQGNGVSVSSTGLVTAQQSNSSATIYVTTNDGACTASCNVSVSRY